MALYIPHSIFYLSRLLYDRPETFGPYYVIFSYWCVYCASSLLIHSNHSVVDPGGSGVAWLLGKRFRILLRTWMFASCVCCVLCRERPLLRADHSSRVLLGVCVCLCVIWKPERRGGQGLIWAVAPQEKVIINVPFVHKLFVNHLQSTGYVMNQQV